MKRFQRSWLTPPLTVLALVFAIAPVEAADTRWFRMGFTPFNYDASEEAQQTVYGLINARQDLIAHHLDDGIPWPEASAGTAYHPNVEGELNERLGATPSGMTIYLATTPISSGRDDLANYWAENGNMPRPGAWAGRDFDDPEVIGAYLNWCRDLLDRFQPRYFNYAIESIELAHNAPDRWAAFLELARRVYPVLKREYPTVQIFVSITLRDPGSPEMTALRPYVDQIMPYSDMMAVSSYRYIFGADENKGDPSTLPSDWLSQAVDMAPEKPFAIAETGWLAENLWIPDWSFFVSGNETWQDEYLQRLFTDAEALDARFLVWFLAVDYDNLYAWLDQLGLATPAWLLWRDTGLWDGSVSPRPSLGTWDAWHARARVPVPPPVPDGAAWGGTPLRVEKGPTTGDVTVSWDAATCPADGHHLVWLDLGALPAYAIIDEICSAGASGNWVGAPPPGQLLGVLAVADDGTDIEGSHGVDWSGRERPSVSSACAFTRKLTDGVCAP